jgi:hypothetical protein
MFYYLFFRIYRFQTRVVKENSSVAAYRSFMIIGAFFWFNCFSIFIAIDKNGSIIDFFDRTIKYVDYIVPLVPMAFFVILSYFMFFFNKKYERIISNIENGNIRKNRINNILAISYQIASFLFFLFALGYSFS